MKVFWAWQSDTPGKIGRHLIRDALSDAIELLKEDPEIVEPLERENIERLHLDQDRQGVPGSPDLARVILEKIDAATVVVADVTIADLVALESQDRVRRRHINSNVAIELGYALRALTDRNVVLVFNSHYGGHEDLPFDIRHKGGAVAFELSPEATKEVILTQRRILTDKFKVALKPYLAAPTEVPRFPETPSTYTPAAYFEPEEVLAEVGDPDSDELRYFFPIETTSLSYFRLIPTKRLASPFKYKTLLDSVGKLQNALNRKLVSPIIGQNKHGVVAFFPATLPTPGGPARLSAVTQLFRNGEVWHVDASLIVRERGARPTNFRVPFLPIDSFEKGYKGLAETIVKFTTNELGISPPWIIECGLCQTVGMYLGVQLSGEADFYGPIRISEVVRRENIPSEKEVTGFLLRFFSEVFDASGHERRTR